MINCENCDGDQPDEDVELLTLHLHVRLLLVELILQAQVDV